MARADLVRLPNQLHLIVLNICDFSLEFGNLVEDLLLELHRHLHELVYLARAARFRSTGLNPTT